MSKLRVKKRGGTFFLRWLRTGLRALAAEMVSFWNWSRVALFDLHYVVGLPKVVEGPTLGGGWARLGFQIASSYETIPPFASAAISFRCSSHLWLS